MERTVEERLLAIVPDANHITVSDDEITFRLARPLVETNRLWNEFRPRIIELVRGKFSIKK